MQKLLLATLFCSGLLTSPLVQADLIELSDTELASVEATMDIKGALIGLLQHKIALGQDLTPQEVFQSLQELTRMFGIDLEDITFSGTEYGDLKLTLINGPGTVGSTRLPSSYETIYVGAVRIAGGKSMGSLEIHNLRITGEVKVTVRN